MRAANKAVTTAKTAKKVVLVSIASLTSLISFLTSLIIFSDVVDIFSEFNNLLAMLLGPLIYTAQRVFPRFVLGGSHRVYYTPEMVRVASSLLYIPLYTSLPVGRPSGA